MQLDRPRVLVISSCPLSIGPAAIADQYREALKRKGCEVDLLLKNPEPGRPDILYVLDKEERPCIIKRVYNTLKNKVISKKYPKSGYYFFYRKEEEPPVDSQRILDKITKPYDLVFVVFWQTMLSFESIDKIYDKLHCQFQFAGVDYSQMSGGCHFTNGCQRYKIGCGSCPAFDSKNENDFTAWNVQYRKKVYDKVKPIVFGNHYMQEFYKESILLRNARLETYHSMIIDTDVFKPLDKSSVKVAHDILLAKKTVIFFACQNLDDERKGIKYLIEALNILYDKVSDKADEIMVIMAGKDFEKVKTMIPFDSKGFGYVQMDKLPELYSVSTVYVCPSVNDAGPMMVGQSLCCGTPVVGFDMGSVKDLVKDKGTGICVPFRDSKALAEAIEIVIKMPKNEYSDMSDRCREVAMRYCSYDAQADMILNAYHKYK